MSTSPAAGEIKQRSNNKMWTKQCFTATFMSPLGTFSSNLLQPADDGSDVVVGQRLGPPALSVQHDSPQITSTESQWSSHGKSQALKINSGSVQHKVQMEAQYKPWMCIHVRADKSLTTEIPEASHSALTCSRGVSVQWSR